MDNKRICFIYCVNDYEQLKKSLKTIRRLEVPPGYQIEFVLSNEATSMTDGYNRAMEKSRAKYKIYLHQDVYILNRHLLADTIALFEKYPKLGMLGVVGTKCLPESGVWWQGEEKYGKVHESSPGKMRLLTFNEIVEDYEHVQAVDGLFMMTQYDLPWREDLFKSWHFYDTSQCMEYLKVGYEVGVPKQGNPWILHDCGIVDMKGYDNERTIFLEKYLKD